MTDQTYCDRLVQDTPFLTGHGRLSEQQVDRIILQLNRYYPQILTNKEAEKFRNPKASLRVRLCDLLSHLQRSGERDCQEFYRALYIHAQPLHSACPAATLCRPPSGPEGRVAGTGSADVGLCLPLSPPSSVSLSHGSFHTAWGILYVHSCPSFSNLIPRGSFHVCVDSSLVPTAAWCS
ncbi:CARD19 isoform 2 [Pan troglodytes]|uniref:Caspase recruitment domain-containing protein 19 n=1 Tax=Pan troglodytes TaxID=9598 RepID=A0A2J8IXA5_PANTR|nr:CARD19 isoform 2 [Pan troglodytes]